MQHSHQVKAQTHRLRSATACLSQHQEALMTLPGEPQTQQPLLLQARQHPTATTTPSPTFLFLASCSEASQHSFSPSGSSLANFLPSFKQRSYSDCTRKLWTNLKIQTGNVPSVAGVHYAAEVQSSARLFSTSRVSLYQVAGLLAACMCRNLERCILSARTGITFEPYYIAHSMQLKRETALLAHHLLAHSHTKQYWSFLPLLVALYSVSLRPSKRLVCFILCAPLVTSQTRLKQGVQLLCIELMYQHNASRLACSCGRM